MVKSSTKKSSVKVKKDDDLSTVFLQGMLFDATSGRELDEGDKNDTDKYREYYNAKVIALTLEDKNNSRLVLFPSVSGDKREWYKMGGNSALFYKYFVGPRLKKNPKMRRDTDLRHRFKHGVATVHWADKFIEDMKGLGYPCREVEYGVLVFELNRTFAVKDIKEMQQKEREDNDKVKTMIIPRENFPDIYGNLNAISRILPAKVRRMDAMYRDIFGGDMLKSLATMYKIYFRMANGRLDKETAKLKMLSCADDITALLAVIDENGLFDLVTRTRIGTALIDLKSSIERRMP